MRRCSPEREASTGIPSAGTIPTTTVRGHRPSGAIRQGDYKLIEFFEDDRVELYHLKEDPREDHDLASVLPHRAKALKARLHAWRAEVGARMPEPNPKYEAEGAR